MQEIILKIDGMMCGHCEAHVNDAIRNAFPVKNVSSSHQKGETVIQTRQPVDVEQLKATVEQTGYRVLDVTVREAQEKRGLFGRLGKR